MPHQLIDLSHRIEDGTITYQGLPGPVICDFLSREASRAFYSDGSTFQIAKIEMVANTGTYIDLPFHRYEQGEDLAQVALERLANLEGLLIDASHAGLPARDRSWFEAAEVSGKAVLVRTDWSQPWGDDQ